MPTEIYLAKENAPEEYETIDKADKRDTMKFEPLTLCPIDKEAIVTDMLTDEEINWFNEYHKMVYSRV